MLLPFFMSLSPLTDSFSCCYAVLPRVWVSPSRPITTLECIQLQHDTVDTPLLPPDAINMSPDNSYNGTKRSSRFRDAEQARSEYQKLRKSKASILRKRQFVYGAIYDDLFPGYHAIDPISNDYDLLVTLHSKKVSRIYIRLVTPDIGLDKGNLLTSMVEVGRTLKGQGNCRGTEIGELGSMHAIGSRSASAKATYVTNEKTASKVEIASEMMTDWMQDNLRDVLASIRAVDAQMKVEPTPSMKKPPGSTMDGVGSTFI